MLSPSHPHSRLSSLEELAATDDGLPASNGTGSAAQISAHFDKHFDSVDFVTTNGVDKQAVDAASSSVSSTSNQEGSILRVQNVVHGTAEPTVLIKGYNLAKLRFG
jgi:hypothetical protein